MNGKASRDYSRELQEKLEIYLIGLIFTLLAAAVQTAKFGGSLVGDALELASWLVLFVSGLAGLSRLEWLPVAHLVHGATQDVEGEVEQLEQLQQAGQQVVTDDDVEGIPIADALTRRKTKLAELAKREDGFTSSTRAKYLVHKWTFVIGLALVLAARGWSPARAAIESATSVAASGAVVRIAPAASAASAASR